MLNDTTIANSPSRPWVKHELTYHDYYKVEERGKPVQHEDQSGIFCDRKGYRDGGEY